MSRAKKMKIIAATIDEHRWRGHFGCACGGYPFHGDDGTYNVHVAEHIAAALWPRSGESSPNTGPKEQEA